MVGGERITSRWYRAVTDGAKQEKVAGADILRP